MTQRQEPDQVKILSGVFEGQTTGTSIGLLVENVDQRSGDYSKIKDSFRPGHADYTYQQKYGIRDYRGGGRASARETVMRVAAGAIARKYLREQLGVEIRGYLAEIGPFELAATDLEHVDENPFFCADPSELPQLEHVHGRVARGRRFDRRADQHHRFTRAGRVWASRCSTSSRPISPTGS